MSPDVQEPIVPPVKITQIGEIIGCSEREADLKKLKDAMSKRSMSFDAYTEIVPPVKITQILFFIRI